MNLFVMAEKGREHTFTIVSAQIAFAGSDDNERTCKIQVIALHPDLPQNAIFWFAALKGVRGSSFTLQEQVMELGAGFYLFEHSALEDVNLKLQLENRRWHLQLSCALFSMGCSSQTFRVTTDLELCDDFDLQCA